MTGGDLKIEVLPAGAVVPAFGVLDAVSKGTLDGAHGVVVYHYGKAERPGAVGIGPGLRHGCQHAPLLAQIRRRQGVAGKTLRFHRRERGFVPLRADADAALRLVQKPITKLEDLKGQKFRTVGLSVDVYTAMGAAVNALPGGEIVPALDRGLLDGAEFNNASSDRLLGFADVSKVCMLQSFHQNAEQFEILFNKPKYEALPEKMKAIISGCVEAASADMSWKAIDRYSKDYIELQTKDKVKFYKTPDAILQKQLEVYDEVVTKKSADNPLFKEIIESQRAFAARTVAWDMDTYTNRRMAYNHYFGAKKVKAPAKKG